MALSSDESDKPVIYSKFAAVRTVCFGKRFCLPNSHVMIHQVSGGAQGTASDVERTIGFMFNLKKRLNGILAKHTGKTEKQIEKDADRDNYMTAEEAVAYGLVDKVLAHHSDDQGDKKKTKA